MATNIGGGSGTELFSVGCVEFDTLQTAFCNNLVLRVMKPT
jgi:hypothetical protein